MSRFYAKVHFLVLAHGCYIVVHNFSFASICCFHHVCWYSLDISLFALQLLIIGLVSFLANIEIIVYNIQVIALLQISGVAHSLVKELSSRFPTSTLMDALEVVYPQYWLRFQVEELLRAISVFLIH
jgi:hypothetical protein